MFDQCLIIQGHVETDPVAESNTTWRTILLQSPSTRGGRSCSGVHHTQLDTGSFLITAPLRGGRSCSHVHEGHDRPSKKTPFPKSYKYPKAFIVTLTLSRTLRENHRKAAHSRTRRTNSRTQEQWLELVLDRVRLVTKSQKLFVSRKPKRKERVLRSTTERRNRVL